MQEAIAAEARKAERAAEEQARACDEASRDAARIEAEALTEAARIEAEAALEASLLEAESRQALAHEYRLKREQEEKRIASAKAASDFASQLALASGAGLPNSAAQLYVGDAYEHGKGTVINLQEALNWYKRAADAGNANAVLRVAKAVLNGELGYKASANDAVGWFEKAEKLGNPEAKAQMDAWRASWAKQKVLKEQLLLATNGNSVAANYVGHAYEQGDGTAANFQEALNWYKRAADAGNANAVLRVAKAVLNGELGYKASANDAVGWFEKAEKLGNPEAKAQMDAWRANWAKTEELNTHIENAKIESSARASAEYFVAWCYEHGWGCEINYTAALEWYTASANLGHKDAAFRLAAVNLCQELGIASASLPLAKEWMRRAASLNHRLAKTYQDVYLRLNTPEQTKGIFASFLAGLEQGYQSATKTEADDLAQTRQCWPKCNRFHTSIGGEVHEGIIKPPTVLLNKPLSVESGDYCKGPSFVFETVDSKNATRENATQQFISGSSEFLVISDKDDESGQTYLQFSRTNVANEFAAEYRAGNESRHYHLKKNISEADLIVLIDAYVARQKDWSKALKLRWSPGWRDP